MSISRRSKPINQGISGHVNAWLQSWGFLANPFEKWDADREYLPLLSRYYIKPPFYDQLLTENRSALVYARRGAGKSAARLMLQSECGPISGASAVLSVSLTDFSHFVDDFTSVQTFTLKDYVKLIIPAVLSQLLVALSVRRNSVTSLNKEQLQELRFWLDEFAPYWKNSNYKNELIKAVSSLVDLKSALSYRSESSGIAALIQESQENLGDQINKSDEDRLLLLWDQLMKNTGQSQRQSFDSATHTMAAFIGFCRAILSYKTLTCQALFLLVDGVDEYQLTQKDPKAAATLLSPLLGNLNFLAIPGLAIKFFLPMEFRAAFESVARADRIPTYTLSWLDEVQEKESRDRMRELFQTRLIRYSNGEISNLGEMCTSELRNIIEDTLVQEAKGVPRHILQLGNQVFIEHCRNTPELESEISTRDLNRAIEWFRGSVTSSASISVSRPRVERSSLTTEGSTSLLRIDLGAGRVYVGEAELPPLPDLAYKLLAYLYRRKGDICSRDEIIQAVYENELGITDETLGSLMYRLRNALQKVAPEFSREHYIKTEDGRGYSLQNAEDWAS